MKSLTAFPPTHEMGALSKWVASHLQLESTRIEELILSFMAKRGISAFLDVVSFVEWPENEKISTVEILEKVSLELNNSNAAELFTTGFTDKLEFQYLNSLAS